MKIAEKTEDEMRSERRRKSQLILPPCRVCGGNATGIHYGLNTCQGCKAFFQRYQKRNEPYTCTRDKKCKIVARKRGICSACRMDKCIALGMSKDGIRLGRYTLTERTETIKEVNNIKTSNETSSTTHRDSSIRQRMMKELYDRVPSEQRTMLCSCPFGDKYDSQIHEDKSITENDWIHTVDLSNIPYVNDCDTSSLLSTDSFISPEESFLPFCLDMCKSRLTGRIPEEYKPQKPINLDEMTDEENQACVDRLTDAYLKMVVTPNMSKEDIDKLLQTKHEKYKEQVEVFGEMKALSIEEYQSIHQQTGLDVDGRLGLANKLRHHDSECKKRYMAFVQNIPNFSTLSPEDQNSLVASSSFECDLLCSQRGINPILGMILLKTGDVFHKDQIYGMFESREKCCMNMEMCEQIQKLNLTDRELALCLAVVATFSDRRRLHNPGTVEQIQMKIISLLNKTLYQRHKTEASGYFIKIINLLTSFRSYTEETKKSLRKIYQDQFNRNVPPYYLTPCLIEY